MRRLSLFAIFLSFSLCLPAYAGRSKQVERLDESRHVIQEVMKIPEKSIPRDLFEKAECVVIIPSMKKAAFGVGGNYGRGCVLCRQKDTWSPPVMMLMTGGSFGLQIGGSAIDIVLLVMNERGVKKLLQSKFTLGVDASVAAGPIGRTASAMTDVQMHAEILSYARSRGVFIGISIDGSVLKPDGDDNEDLYRKEIDPKKLLLEGGPVPREAKDLIKVLDQY